MILNCHDYELNRISARQPKRDKNYGKILLAGWKGGSPDIWATINIRSWIGVENIQDGLIFSKQQILLKKLQFKIPLPPIAQQEPIFKSADIISLMDVLQRISNPQELLQNLLQNLRPGGLLIAVCRAGSGFDVLTLRENSESIFPLDHIYLPSPQGLKLLLEKSGFAWKN